MFRREKEIVQNNWMKLWDSCTLIWVYVLITFYHWEMEIQERHKGSLKEKKKLSASTDDEYRSEHRSPLLRDVFLCKYKT